MAKIITGINAWLPTSSHTSPFFGNKRNSNYTLLEYLYDHEIGHTICTDGEFLFSLNLGTYYTRNQCPYIIIPIPSPVGLNQINWWSTGVNHHAVDTRKITRIY